MNISVIVPSYKRTNDMVKRALMSLVNQTMDHDQFEVILVDDNAEHQNYRNDVARLVEQLHQDYPGFNLTYLTNEKNLGGSLSRNIGVESSKGTYITFLDDDDYYLPQKLQEQYDYITAQAFDMIFGNLLIKNEKDKLVDRRSFNRIKDFSNEALLRYHLVHHITGTPTFMLKRDKFIEIGGFPVVKMGQEFHLMFMCIQKGLKIGYLDKDLVVATVHSGERISVGPNKIAGSRDELIFKRQYFHLLSKKEVKFIQMRSHAVLAYNYLKMKDYKMFGIESARSFRANPTYFAVEVVKRLSKKE